MELIITTEEKIEEIVNRCLSNHVSSPPPSESLQSKNLYSINALAAFLGCSPVTAQKYKNQGKFRYRQFGRKCIFNTVEIMDDLQKSATKKLK